jgi:general secretion pathway protein L
MNRYLLIRLARDANDRIVASWVGCDARGVVTSPPLTGPLTSAVSQTAGAEVVALIPSGDVVSLSAELPARTSGRWQQAVPFAIEEQLADNVEDMQVAVGPRGSGSQVPVAVIARDRLRQYLDVLKESGIGVAALYAESALLPANPGQVVALLLGDSILMRLSDGAYCNVPADPLGAAFDIACGGDPTRHSLLLYATPADWQARSDQVDALRERFLTVKVQLLPQGPLPFFAQHLPHTQAINLLQGDFPPTARTATSWRDWRLAAALALLLLGLHLGSQLFTLNKLRGAEKTLDARLLDLGRGLLPGATLADPSQLREQLAARMGTASSDDLALEIMTALANAKSGIPELKIESLRFQAGAIELTVRTDNADSVERMNNQLRSGGWQAELLGGAAANPGYQGRIRIRRGAAS